MVAACINIFENMLTRGPNNKKLHTLERRVSLCDQFFNRVFYSAVAAEPLRIL